MEQPREREAQIRLVQVRLALLSELQELQRELNALITGYVSFFDLSGLCARVRSRLELSGSKREQLQESYYWNAIRDALTDMSKSITRLESRIKERSKEPIESLEEELEKAVATVSGALRSPAGADLDAIWSSALCSVERMYGVIDDVAGQSKVDADSVLERLGQVMAQIFERIEFTEDQLAAVSSRQPVGYEVKLREEETGDKRMSLGLVRRENWVPRAGFQADTGPAKPDRSTIRLLLVQYFDEEEIRSLAFDLEVDYDSLRGEGKASKTRELVAHMDRHGRLSEFLEIGPRLRSDVPWEDALVATERDLSTYRTAAPKRVHRTW
jgi:hypothetical protein